MSKAQVIVTSCSRRGLEIEQIKNVLKGNGFVLSDDDWTIDPDADVILVSTCGFTQAAEDFGFETLGRIQAAKKTGARVVLGGCIPEINPRRVSQEFDGPTFSPQSYAQLDDILGLEHGFQEFERPNTFKSQAHSSIAQDTKTVIEILRTFDGSFAGLEYLSHRLSDGFYRRLIRTRYANLENHRTFYIQIQEGCSMNCTYCAIKVAIGPLASKPMEAILAQFRTGLSQGFKHFQLMGDNAGSYGLDIGANMGQLLERIGELEGDFDLDLTDIHPVYLPLIFEPLMRLLAQKRASRLYVPIQSGNRRILKLMGRNCDLDAVKRMLVEIKISAPKRFRMGTSVIVGFPSETIDELGDTISFCRDAGFDWIWCHSFSARPETPAAALAGQIPPGEILRRARWIKSRLRNSALVTTAADAVGSRTCQG